MRRIVLGVIASCALVSWLGGCAKPAASSPAIAEVPAQSFIRQWSVDLSSERKAKVVALHSAGEYVFAITDDRLSYVIRKDTGSLIAVHPIGGRGDISPPFTNGKLFAYPVSTTIELFNLEGKAVRTVDLKSVVRSTGVFSAEMVFVGVTAENGGRIRGIDPGRAHDTPKWEVMTFGALLAAPTYFDQAAFFATESGRVYAVSDQGVGQWALPGGFFQAGGILADLASDDFALYVASTDTRLMAVNRKSGRIIWQYFAGQPLYEKPVPTADTVYIAVRNQGLVALPKTEGDFSRRPRWISREATSLLAEDDKYAYVRLRGNSIGAIEKMGGAVAFRSAPTNFKFMITNPTQNGLVLAATEDGKVFGIRPVTKPGTVGEVMFK